LSWVFAILLVVISLLSVPVHSTAWKDSFTHYTSCDVKLWSSAGSSCWIRAI